MIGQKHLTIVEAWIELNKINNRIDLLEKTIITKFDISSSKLKEVLTQCSVVNNDRFINAIVAKEKGLPELSELYKAKKAWEEYIDNEIEITKATEPEICVAFLKEYKGETNKEISHELKDCSISTVKRLYAKYKGKTPPENDWFDDVK